MCLRILFSVVVAAGLLGECIQAPETRTGLVHFLAADFTGTSIDAVEAEVRTLDGVTVIQRKTKELRLPYGRYELRLWAAGFHMTRREIRLAQPEMWVRANLAVGIECPPEPAVIGGRVRRKGAGELWVKATPVRGLGGGETRVYSTGVFQIAGLEYGRYLLTVMEGEAVLHQQVVESGLANSPAARLDIDLT